VFDRRLFLHLVTWLGQWPAGPGLHVVGSPRRTRPGWDGQTRPVVGVGTPTSTLLSVPLRLAPAARLLPAGSVQELLAGLPALLDRPDWRGFRAVFRSTRAPAPLPDAGEWVCAGDPVVPQWLRPFGRDVLLARDDDGRYLAGVGVKRHDRYGHELAVGTEPVARGRGLARRLVAQAARRVLDEGAVPTYLHAPDNVASARVAEAAGFADRGWSTYGLFKADGA
jgi:GNAT superfamily N-acetyltransferase